MIPNHLARQDHETQEMAYSFFYKCLKSFWTQKCLVIWSDFKSNDNPVGVGRYTLDKKPRIPCGLSMDSKTERFLNVKDVKYFAERIRSKDTLFSDLQRSKSIMS